MNPLLFFLIVMLTPQVGQAQAPLARPSNPPALIYWCPNRTADQQITASPYDGCTPLIEEENEAGTQREKNGPVRQPIKLERIQGESSQFLRDYRHFLDCCAQDVDFLDEVEDLRIRASDLLKAIQLTGFVNMGTSQRGMTLREILPPIAQARDDLRKLKTRLEQLGRSKETVETLGYEEAGRERRKIQHEENAISKQFRPKRPPAAARTGTEIEATTLPNRVGVTTEPTTLPNASGPDISDIASPGGQQQDLNPRRGPDIQNTTLPNRYGSSLGGNTPEINLPTSTGAEIDSTQGPTGPSTNPSRLGPEIGDSSLNSR